MNIKEYAQKLDNRQYGYPQFTKEELLIAKDNGFVIVCGASDDLMEFYGAITDEGDCFEGGTVWFNRERVTDGPITTAEKCIEALWGEEDDITWTSVRFVAFADRPLTLVDENDIENFLAYIKANGNQNTSVNNHRRNLSAFFTWMRKQKLRPDNPVEGVEAYKVENKPIDHMEAPEWEQLKTGCKHPRDRAMIEFLRCTATRVGEVEGVKICDIDWRSGKITVNGRKTSTYRPVCLDDIAIKYIQQYLDWRGVSHTSREQLFTYIRGDIHRMLGKDGLYSAVKQIAKRAKMDRNVYPHLFRKTTATNIVKRGGSEEAAGEYLGHKPKNVTGRHYSFKSEEHTLRIFKDYVAAV